VPPEIAGKVRLYLQQLAIEAEPPPFSATLFSGIRWESNANAAPASQNITLNGIDFTLDSTSVAAPDWSAVNIGTIHYGWDLKNQGDRIEFDAITYNADYFNLTDINLNFFEATLGPSFNLKRIGWDKSRFFVYGIGDEVLLGNDQYFAAGGGIRLLSFAAARSVLDVRLETRVRQFTNTTDRPTNTLRDGAQNRFGGSYSYYLGLLLSRPGPRPHRRGVRSTRERRRRLLRQLGGWRIGGHCLDLRQSARGRRQFERVLPVLRAARHAPFHWRSRCEELLGQSIPEAGTVGPAVGRIESLSIYKQADNSGRAIALSGFAERNGTPAECIVIVDGNGTAIGAGASVSERPDLERNEGHSLGRVGWRAVAALPPSATVCALVLFPGEAKPLPLADCKPVAAGAGR
jgi:hypothetical protein